MVKAVCVQQHITSLQSEEGGKKCNYGLRNTVTILLIEASINMTVMNGLEDVYVPEMNQYG